MDWGEADDQNAPSGGILKREILSARLALLEVASEGNPCQRLVGCPFDFKWTKKLGPLWTHVLLQRWLVLPVLDLTDFHVPDSDVQRLNSNNTESEKLQQRILDYNSQGNLNIYNLDIIMI